MLGCLVALSKSTIPFEYRGTGHMAYGSSRINTIHLSIFNAAPCIVRRPPCLGTSRIILILRYCVVWNHDATIWDRWTCAHCHQTLWSRSSTCSNWFDLTSNWLDSTFAKSDIKTAAVWFSTNQRIYANIGVNDAGDQIDIRNMVMFYDAVDIISPSSQ